MTKKAILSLMAVALVVAGVAVIRHKKQALAHLPPPPNPPVPVRTASVRSGTVARTVDTVAVVVAQTAATVAAQVSGTLLEVRFREGDTVRKGDIMARIDPTLLDETIRAAEARVAAAQENLAKEQAVYSRDQVLFENQAISQQALEASAARLAAAKAALADAQTALAHARTLRTYADVPAPYTAVVSARLVEPGDLAAPGKPLFTLQVPGNVKLISKLSQESLKLLKAGAPVVFSFAGETMEAKTSRTYPALDATHLGTVETDLPELPFGLPPGATVSARYTAQPSAGLVVPADAVLSGLTETLVVRVKDGKAEPVAVAVVSQNDREAAVSGPLEVGDTVVVGLPSELMALTAGTPVAPVAADRS